MIVHEPQSLLEPYRVLDLTEGGYLLAGKVLGDLGADVIKIEPHGGSPSRNIGPFYQNRPDSQNSLFWFALNTNKRSFNLDIETANGKELFRRLVKSSDFVIESFEPGYLEGLGLNYEALREINPRLIVTSITPFGSRGPYSRYKASDLTIWAMGGFLGATGVADRPPVSVTYPQASQHAGNYAAAASMIAHWYRETTGEGQHVVVSAQQCVVLALYSMPRWWEFQKIERAPRTGGQVRLPNAEPGMNAVYNCKDGEVYIGLQGGASVVHHTSSINLVKYMSENGMASDWLKKFDWIWGYDATTITQDVIDRIEGEVHQFLLTKTKKELYEEALRRRILLAPFADARDVYENPQLQTRDFWVKVPHPELNTSVTYPGPFLKLTENPITYRRRPPLIGEHNEEISADLANRKTQPLNYKIQHSLEHKQALEGIKVADFSWSIVGPLAARYLADYGATVVRVESHTRPETQRVGGPYKDNIPGIDRSSLFSLYNTSKYGMSLNIEKPKGKEIAIKLMKWADVVLESFTPGTMKKLGLDYETIRKEKPEIIYASSSLYGQYGPISGTSGYGQMATAQAGITNMIGWPDQPTATNSMPHTDFISPPFLVTSIMAALDYRRRTEKGLYIDQSQVEAGVHFFAPPVMDYLANKKIMQRDGNHYPYAVPHGVYPCRGNDRWCAVAVFTDKEWRGFCDVFGNPQWAKETRFDTFLGRKKNEEELDRLVSELTLNLTPTDIVSRMQERGISAGIVKTLKELYEDPQLKHLGFWRYLDHPVLGIHAHQGPPFSLSKTPDHQFTSPCLGQHNAYVYKELLGFSDDEVADLLVEGVITSEADLPEFRTAF
ncbi:MAG: CoA transferase [Dehalococcoidales bacterium]|nr:CoA transferase [Dehalococcoidales bacterium]